MSADSRIVILVDDVPINLKVMEAMLKRLGVKCMAFASAGEALAQAKETHPALVISDMWMPGMGGIELAAKLKELPTTADIPVVAVTADTRMNEQTAPKVFRMVLLKPITVDKLRHVLECFVPQE